jgi:uncharacterized protein (TIGR03435 family)
MSKGLREINMRRLGYAFGFRRKRLLTAVALIAVAASTLLLFGNATQSRAQLLSQNTAANSPVFEYDVVSVKPSKFGGGGRGGALPVIPAEQPADGFTAANVFPMWLIQTAFGVDYIQVQGAPAWLNSEQYVVEAKVDSSVADALQKLSADDRRVVRRRMLQTLLADRFKLTVHRETKELPVYSFVIAKGGSKLREAKAGEPRLYKAGADGAVIYQAIPFAELVRTFADQLGRTIVDKTGITGTYDVTLKFSLDDSRTDSNSPSLVTAVEEQLGLKLESGKGPVEIIVIDHIDWPSGN